MTPQVADRNTGHGHVWPRPDGVKARCGGPSICAQCAIDYARYHDKPAPDPETFAMTPPAEKEAEPFNEAAIKELSHIFMLRVATAHGLDASYFEHDVREWLGKYGTRLNAAAPAPSVAQSEREADIDALCVAWSYCQWGRLIAEWAKLPSGRWDHEDRESERDDLRRQMRAFLASPACQARASAGSAVDARAAADVSDFAIKPIALRYLDSLKIARLLPHESQLRRLQEDEAALGQACCATGPVMASRESEQNPGPSLWVLNYFHDWDKPDPDQRPHPKGKLWPETHGVYLDWKDAEAVRKDMSDPERYYVSRAQNFITTHTHTAPPAQEIVDAIQGLLDHACIADAAPEDVDEEDRARERKVRALLTRLTS